MGITYAGRPLLLPDPDGELAAWLGNYLPVEDLRAISAPLIRDTNRTESRGPARVGIARPNYPPPPRPRLNSLYWPTGAGRWAFGLFLADAATVGQLNSSQPATLKISDEERGGGSITPTMHLLPPRPVASPGGEASLYLLPLVDDRYWWQFKSVGELEVETWSELFDALSSALGVSLLPGAVDPDYGIPDPAEVNGRSHDNAALLLDAAAHSVGLRVIRPLSGEVILENADEAGALLGETIGLVAGGMSGASFRSRRQPEQVSVSFPRWRHYHAECNGERFLHTVTSLAATETAGVSGADRTIHTSAFADFSTDSGTPVNSTDVVNLASKIAADQLAWSDQEFDFTLAGVVPWYPTGFDDHVQWLFGSQRGDGNYQAQTRVQSVPANFGVDEMLHQFDDKPVVQSPIQFELNAALSAGGSADATILDDAADKTITLFDNQAAQGAADGTKGWMVYVCERNRWELVGTPTAGAGMAVVRITAATKDANGLYPGKIMSVAASADFDRYTNWVDGADIWVATQLSDQQVVVIGIPHFYFASLLGDGGTPSRPVYLVKDEQSRGRWIEYQNVGEFEIPSWGACFSRNVAGATVNPETGHPVLRLERPGTEYQRQVFINAPVAVPPGSYGIATMDFPVPARMNFTMPQGLELPVGPTPNSYDFSRDFPGWRTKGGDQGGSVVWIVPDNPETVWCKAVTASPGETIAIPSGLSGTVQIWTRAGVNAVDTGWRITVINESGRNIRRDEFLFATYVCGLWRIIPRARTAIMFRFAITAAATAQAEVVRTSDDSVYAPNDTVTLSNPHGFTLEDGMTGEAVDHGNGVPEIISIVCPAGG